MKSTLERTENKAVFKIALDFDEWNAEIEKAYNRTKKRYKVPGFRPGHAPRRFIERYYGESVFFEEAVDLCINRVYGEQIEAHPELDIFGQPDVAFEKAEEGEAFAFSMTVTLYPEIKLEKYKGIKLPKIEYNVTDADVDGAIDAALHRASRLVKVDRAAENGDVTLIDYVGTVDGVAFEGGTAKDYELKLGSGSFIPGFEDGLIGATAGEHRDVAVKFPDEYHAEELKGKDAVFAVTVKEVRAEEIPALDEEFVKDHSNGCNTVDEYKAQVRSNLEQSAAQRTRSERIDAAMNAITDSVKCTIDEKIISAEVERMYDDFAHRMSHYGIKPEDYLKYSNSSPEKYRADSRPQAERTVKMRLIMRAIVEAEKLEPTEDEIKAKLDDEKLQHEAKNNRVSPVTLAANDIVTEKFFDFLIANNEYVLDKAEEPEQKPEEPAEEKPAKKPAAKKSAAKKASSTSAEESAEEKPAKKTAAKKADGEPAAKKTAAKKATAKKPTDKDGE